MKLFINLARNFNRQTFPRYNYFKDTSIKQQYEAICRKYPTIKKIPFESFVKSFFPDKETRYYVCMPSFVRDPDVYDEPDFYNYQNVVVRAVSYDDAFDKDLLLFGDVSIKKGVSNWRNELVVKGLDFIDPSIEKYGERAIDATANIAFTLSANRPVYPDGGLSVGNSALTKAFIDDMLLLERPVPNFDEASGVYSEWDSYLSFRFDYLDKLSKKAWHVASVDLIPTYLVERATFNSDKSLKQYCLGKPDKLPKSAPTVLLTEPVEGAKEYPVVKIVVNDTHQQYNTNSLDRETNPRSYEMMLAANAGIYETDSDASVIELGERYYYEHETIEPKCDDILNKAASQKAEKESQIRAQYAKLIADRLDKDENIITLRESARKHLLDELNISLDGEIEYSVQMFDGCEDNVKQSIRSRIAEFDRMIENAKLNFAMKSRNKTGRHLTHLEEARDKQIEEANRGKKRAFESYLEKYNIDPIEGRIGAKLDAEMAPVIEEQKRRLEVRYENEIADAISQSVQKIDGEASQLVAKRKKEKTVSRWVFYFLSTPELPESISDRMNPIDDSDIKRIADWDQVLLAHNNNREMVKLKRQRNALENFFNGVVKNPFLALQIFSPKDIKAKDVANMDEPEWFLESLNVEQKKSVKLALNCDGMFLLQGPPGTGKTQVIAELTAQLVKKGKKVAISSETHKAIENVFERLPKTPDIRPFRLSRYGNRSEYRPELLVDNFYANIVGRLESRSKQLKDPNGYKKQFKAAMDQISEVYDDVNSAKDRIAKIDAEIKRLEGTTKKIKHDIEEFERQRDIIEAKTAVFEKIKNYIAEINTEGDADCGLYLSNFENRLMDMLYQDRVFGTVEFSNLKYLYSCNTDEIRADLIALGKHSQLEKMKKKNAEAKRKKAEITDELTEEAIPGHEEEFDDLRITIKNTGAQIKNISSSLPEISELPLLKVIALENILAPNVFDNFLNLLNEFREKIQGIIKESIDDVEKDERDVLKQIDKINESIEDKKRSLSNTVNRIEELRNSDEYSEYSGLETKLRNGVGSFFREYMSAREYSSVNEGMNMIADEWQRVSRRSKALQEEAARRLPVYKSICKYLDNQDLLEEDRERYTVKLYDRVNVYGFTSSAGYIYKDLVKYGIPDINIQSAGIDVVIIDEVSKSAFVDLLVPMLYGKTVVLVGDHRQLPPMYDLRYLKPGDFSDLGYSDPDLQWNENAEFTRLYEESLFKRLFTQARTQRSSLRKQYRCHSQIMDVFNYFYGSGGPDEGLQVGSETQDQTKDHLLTMPINGKPFISPDKHIYFVDCNGEDKNENGSSSKVNEEEAAVIETLLLKMNDHYGELVNNGTIAYDADPSKKIDARPSIGVICTYGDQARLLRNWYKQQGRGARYFTNKREERLMFDTVDNFQGDERDIIIVSMVRSPKAGTRPDAEFIKQFERINVAYSRARKMLIIVGNRNYLANECRVDLPDMYGRGPDYDRINYPVYQKIIETIDQKGAIISSDDVIGVRNETN